MNTNSGIIARGPPSVNTRDYENENLNIERNMTMKILFINNSGGGFADYIEIEPNTSIRMLFDLRMKEENPSDYLIRVNRQPVPQDYVLQENDRVTITPVKIEGAEPVSL